MLHKELVIGSDNGPVQQGPDRLESVGVNIALDPLVQRMLDGLVVGGHDLADTVVAGVRVGVGLHVGLDEILQDATGSLPTSGDSQANSPPRWIAPRTTTLLPL